MKKLFISLCLFLAMSSVYAQTFVPDPTKVYNIVEAGSQMVVGAPPVGATQPILTVLKNSEDQAFNFIPTGAPNTYNILSVANMYLAYQSTTSWDHWSCSLDAALNGTYSEWVIVGTDSTGIRLYNNFKLTDPTAGQGGPENDYLGSDGTSDGSGLYCNKSSTQWSGVYELKVATIDETPKFHVSDKVVIEIEKGTPYPIFISASKQTYNIDATISAGFTLYDVPNNYTPVNKLTFAPTDFTSNSGTISFPIQESTAAVGDSGKVVFSYTSGGVTHNIDSIKIRSVVPYDRVIIKNNASKFVIASDHSNSATPMLDTLTVDNGSEYFYLRPVHKNVNDSLYFIIQDGDYKAFMKDISSGYKTTFGILEDSLSVWKITPLANGVKKITNMGLASPNDLGTDGVTLGNGVWLNKTFKANPNSGPYCEWSILSAATALDISSSVLASVSLSSGFLDKNFDGATTSYIVKVPVDVDSVQITGTTLATISTITTNPVELYANTPAVLSVVSQDLTSTTNYNFSLAKNDFTTWAANGSTTVTPKQYGWKCRKPDNQNNDHTNWDIANTNNSDACMYFDNPANYSYNGVAGWTGRALLMYWDGNVTDVNSVKADTVYSFPVSLESGKPYKFVGQYAWSSVAPVDSLGTPLSSTFTFGINTQSDNKGTSVASLDSIVQPTDLMNFHDVALNFTAPASGVYYLTIKNNVAIKAAIANLSISSLNGINNPVSGSVYATVSNQTINVHGTLAGDAVKVYNISGQLVKQLTANSDITSINLNSGVYLIKVNANVLKVVK